MTCAVPPAAGQKRERKKRGEKEERREEGGGRIHPMGGKTLLLQDILQRGEKKKKKEGRQREGEGDPIYVPKFTCIFFNSTKREGRKGGERGRTITTFINTWGAAKPVAGEKKGEKKKKQKGMY